ncbi:hypothetical protein D7X33_17405 [Butyricicoccus sp. 1XD8-22]|nr:hypothetical protein D7X33_17405 [Butyricicoccus sp. 1XD8-22]
MRTSFAGRLLCMAAVSALCFVPLRLNYRRLDTSCVPEEMARWAVPAYRYELEISHYSTEDLPPPGVRSLELYCYDRQGRELCRVTDEAVQRCRRYDLSGRLHTERIPALGSKTYAYDAAGRLLRAEVDYGAALRSVTTYTWGADGTGTLQTSGETPSGPFAESGACGPDGRLTLLETADYRKTWEYDARGGCIREITVSGPPVNGSVRITETAFTYDADGNVLSAVYFTDGSWARTLAAAYQDGARTWMRDESAAGYTERAFADVTLP